MSKAETVIEEGQRVVAERFRSYRQLAAGSAYQLEAPLAKLCASLLRLQQDAHDPGDLADGVMRDEHGLVSEALLDAVRASEQVAEVVHRLKAFASGIEACPLPIDVHDAIDVASLFLQREIDARARLVRRFAAVPAVNAPLPKLVDVLMAVLRNAAESIPPFSTIANSIAIVTSEVEGAVVIEISDTGVGIQAEIADRVFEPFFTTKRDSDAVGLGLTSARATILELGGEIELETVCGRGTTCRIRLPADARRPFRSVPFFAADMPRRRVLAIADDAETGCALRDLFEDEHTMVRVATEEEALESLMLGESWHLIVFGMEVGWGDRLRDRIAALAPEVLMRVFELPIANERSGVRRLGRHVRASAQRSPHR